LRFSSNCLFGNTQVKEGMMESELLPWK